MQKQINDLRSKQHRALCDIIQRSKAINLFTMTSISDVVRVVYASLKRLSHHVTWWVGVDDATQIPFFSLTLLLNNTCNSNINQNNCDNNNNNNNNTNNNNNNNNNNSYNIIARLE